MVKSRNERPINSTFMNKVIVISGGSDGLGKSIASVLSAENTVVVLSSNEERLKEAAEKLNCEWEVCDISDSQVTARIVEKIVLRHGRIDCLVNNAGLWIEGALDSHSPDVVKRVFEVNTLGTIYLSMAVIPHMKCQKSGRIININSERGLSGKSGRSIYTASKWAITGLTRSLQPELAPFGISVTGIYPGKMSTKLFEKAGVAKDLVGALHPKEVASLVSFLVDSNPSVVFPDISIRSLED